MADKNLKVYAVGGKVIDGRIAPPDARLKLSDRDAKRYGLTASDVVDASAKGKKRAAPAAGE